jgi:hypothetical protein
VLNRLIGESPVEVGKSIALGFVTLMALIALQQLAANRSSQTTDQVDRGAVLSVSARFGQALTTYDYAHPAVQRNQLDPLVTPSVRDRVGAALPDLASYRAVSVGETAGVYVQSLDGDRAQVLVETRSTMQSTYAAPGTRSTGLLLCDLERQSSSWRVSGYRWLTPAAEGVS